MWKRILWQYSQWKLLYYLLYYPIHWVLQGLAEEWLFSYLTKYAEGKVGWLMGIIQWLELHPTLSVSIFMVGIAIIIALWAIRDARRKVNGIYQIENVLLEMFNLALREAKIKAQNIKLDKQWDDTMNNIAKDIVGIDKAKYAGKDMKSRREIAKIGKEVRKVTPTDEDSVPIFKLIASALVNNEYGIDEKGLESNRQYIKLKQRLAVLRRVPSKQIDRAINKCLDYIYALSNIYIYQLARMRNKVGLGQKTLAEMRNFIRDQENNAGDISKCLTELRIEIDNFVGGNTRNDK